jgi:hypothetical protein
MRELAPADAKVIDAYISAVRLFFRADVLALPLASAWDVAKLLPWLPGMLKWAQTTMEQFAQRFSDPFLRRAFPVIQYDLSEVPMLLHLNFRRLPPGPAGLAQRRLAALCPVHRPAV